MPEGTPASRFRAALDLYEVGEPMMRCRLRREHPEWTETEVASALRRWLQDRPGAPYGDYPGPPSQRDLGRVTS